MLVETVLSHCHEIKLSLLSASIREKLFKSYTGAPILLLFSVCMFLWSFAFGPRYGQICMMTVPYSPTFCIMHCFLCKNFVGFFQKKFVTLVLYLIFPEKVLERTLRTWVSVLDYSMA